ncbi:MAG: M23 family metallopeptidase [Immundisolibacteraceae bacterium]|nr:M23 family metallopeptidase [Immundisolibacteraceae bacterium]
MELIFSYRGKLHRLGLRHLIPGLAMFTAAALALPPNLNDHQPVVADAQVMGSEGVDPQRVERALILAEAQMAELAARLGELQGRLTRLESIGQQVGELAGFDAEALGFDQPVAVGGPVTADDATMELPQLLEELRVFAARLDDRGVRLQLLDQELLTRQTDAWRLPSGRPTRSGWLSSAYGYRTHPLNGRRQFHRGVDLAGKAGDPVEAVASGVVIWSGRKGGYGNLVEVDHRNGFVTRYGHNAKNLVAMGELVKQGQVVATMGSTGRSTGPHVHFEVLKNGKQVNPHKFLKGRRTANLNL